MVRYDADFVVLAGREGNRFCVVDTTGHSWAPDLLTGAVRRAADRDRGREDVPSPVPRAQGMTWMPREASSMLACSTERAAPRR